MKARRWSDEEIRVFHDFIRPIHMKFEKMTWKKLGDLMKLLMDRRSGARRDYTVTAMVNRFSKVHTVEGMTKGHYQARNMRYPTYLRPPPKPATSRCRQVTNFSRTTSRKVGYIRNLKKVEVGLDGPARKKSDKGTSKQSAKGTAAKQRSTECDTESDDDHTRPAKRPMQSELQLNHGSTTSPKTPANALANTPLGQSTRLSAKKPTHSVEPTAVCFCTDDDSISDGRPVPRCQRGCVRGASKKVQEEVDYSSDDASEFNFSEAGSHQAQYISESLSESESTEQESEDEGDSSHDESTRGKQSGPHFSEYMIPALLRSNGKGKGRKQSQLGQRHMCYIVLKYGPTQTERGGYLEDEVKKVKERRRTRIIRKVKPRPFVYCEGIDDENLTYGKAMDIFELWACRETLVVRKQRQIAHWQQYDKMDTNAELIGFNMKPWA